MPRLVPSQEGSSYFPSAGLQCVLESLASHLICRPLVSASPALLPRHLVLTSSHALLAWPCTPEFGLSPSSLMANLKGRDCTSTTLESPGPACVRRATGPWPPDRCPCSNAFSPALFFCHLPPRVLAGRSPTGPPTPGQHTFRVQAHSGTCPIHASRAESHTQERVHESGAETRLVMRTPAFIHIYVCATHLQTDTRANRHTCMDLHTNECTYRHMYAGVFNPLNWSKFY